MKTTLLRFLSLTLLVAALGLSSCKKDKCVQTVTYTVYEPQYMSYGELRSAVKTEAPRALQTPGKIYLKGNYIFVSETGKGIHVIDNTNPAAPQNIAFINVPGNADIAATGNVLYADSYIDMVALDITNPQNVTVLSRVQDAMPYELYYNGYVADPAKGVVKEWKSVQKTEKMNTDCNGNPGGGVMWLEDVFSPGGTPVLNTSGVAGTANVPNTTGVGGSLARFAIAANTLYVVDNSNLKTFNISSPGNPVQSGTANVGRNIETIFPHNNHLFIGSSEGMYIYNINNPLNPSYVSSYMHIFACDPVVVDEHYAYITLRSGTPCNTNINQLEVVDISNISTPTLTYTMPMTNPAGLGIADKTLFICDGNDGLEVYNATNVNTIANNMIASFPNVKAHDVIPYNNVLITIAADGLYQYNYTNLQNITLLSRIPIAQP